MHRQLCPGESSQRETSDSEDSHRRVPWKYRRLKAVATTESCACRRISKGVEMASGGSEVEKSEPPLVNNSRCW